MNNKPLFSKRILVIRSYEQSFSFIKELIKSGAKPVSYPIVSYKIEEKEIYNKSIINNLVLFDWIFFTSQNAVGFFFEILERNYYDSRALAKSQIAAVGYKTKLELEKYNIRADFIPKRFSFKDLIDELNERENLKEKKILHPTQSETCYGMSKQITHWGIYSTDFINNLNEKIISQIKEGIDILTFFSSNTASHFSKLINTHNLQEHIESSLIATIGDETAKTTRQLFGKVDIVAEPFTEEGLIKCMEEYFTRKSILING